VGHKSKPHTFSLSFYLYKWNVASWLSNGLKQVLRQALRVCPSSSILTNVLDILSASVLRWEHRNLLCRVPQNELDNVTGQPVSSQSYITTDGQSASLSWCQAPIWDHRPIFFSSLLYLFLGSYGFVDVGALSDEKSGL
jgi:hypothetical protein